MDVAFSSFWMEIADRPPPALHLPQPCHLLPAQLPVAATLPAQVPTGRSTISPSPAALPPPPRPTAGGGDPPRLSAGGSVAATSFAPYQASFPPKYHGLLAARSFPPKCHGPLAARSSAPYQASSPPKCRGPLVARSSAPLPGLLPAQVPWAARRQELRPHRTSSSPKCRRATLASWLPTLQAVAPFSIPSSDSPSGRRRQVGLVVCTRPQMESQGDLDDDEFFS
nr:proline-rich receptor-like protein kinase PERK9 [Setaria viridis]